MQRATTVGSKFPFCLRLTNHWILCLHLWQTDRKTVPERAWAYFKVVCVNPTKNIFPDVNCKHAIIWHGCWRANEMSACGHCGHRSWRLFLQRDKTGFLCSSVTSLLLIEGRERVGYLMYNGQSKDWKARGEARQRQRERERKRETCVWTCLPLRVCHSNVLRPTSWEQSRSLCLLNCKPRYTTMCGFGFQRELSH